MALGVNIPCGVQEAVLTFFDAKSHLAARQLFSENPVLLHGHPLVLHPSPDIGQRFGSTLAALCSFLLAMDGDVGADDLFSPVLDVRPRPLLPKAIPEALRKALDVMLQKQSAQLEAIQAIVGKDNELDVWVFKMQIILNGLPMLAFTGSSRISMQRESLRCFLSLVTVYST